MKTKFFSFLFLFTPLLLSAQTPAWLWSESAGNSSTNRADNMATDASGNIYVTGEFRGTSIVFGSTTLTNTGSNGTADFYLAKYDASGNVLWAKQASGSATDQASSVCTDANGNVYVTGWFVSATLTFGSTVLTNTNAPGQDLFVVKYDPNGNVLWAKSAGGISNDVGYGVAVDVSGNVLVSGAYSSSSLVFGSTTLTNSGAQDLFITKYDATGTVLWAKKAGGSGSEVALDVCTDPNGNVLLTGLFTSSFLAFGTTSLANSGDADVFIAKYDTAGNVAWAKKAGGADDDQGMSICTDAGGNVFLTGWFNSSTIHFGSLLAVSAGLTDIFVAKYDAAGNAMWAKQAGGDYSDVGTRLCLDPVGNVLVTGSFQSDSIRFGLFTLRNTGGGNVFVVKFDPNSGNTLWATTTEGSAYGEGHGISAGSASVVIAGLFSSDIIFGSDTLLCAGAENIFIAKLDNLIGVDEKNTDAPVAVFPNPFSSQLTVQPERALENGTLVLYNTAGQKVKAITAFSAGPGQPIVLQREGLPAGVYFLQLLEGDEIIVTKKLVVTDN